jgi:ATP-dependent helicase/nuclease subunit A
MSTQEYAYALDGQPCTCEAFYAIACDPKRNVVVQACAGAGKTWMLVSRILRALLNAQTAHATAHATAHVTDKAASLAPQEILAITFTKKAAGEMRQRLQEWLEEFAQADDATLAQALIHRGVSSSIALQPNGILREQLSNLYQSVLASGRTVQIRTFHSWFAALLRSAPMAVLEQLGLPTQYELLEDDSQATQLVWRRFYDALAADDALRSIYSQAVAAHGRFNVDKALSSALDKRVEFALADAAGTVASSIRPFATVYTEFEGLDSPFDIFGQHPLQLQKLSGAALSLGRAPQKSFAEKGVELEKAITGQDYVAAMAALLTQKNEPRKFSEKINGIEQVRIAQELCVRVNAAQQQHEAWLHQTRMAQLARALIACYSALKRERAWVDMGDVERSALHLLSDPVLSGWVQQRLDAQTRHLLIDEFQDTNPLQWQALQAWLASYAGAGGSAPSVFIVGDPKQSIYRFRRAEPQVFVAASDFVCQALGGVVLSCDHTRRNARGVLAAVNGVMHSAAEQGYEGYRLHTTESKEQGQVLRLPLVAREEADANEVSSEWRDTLTTARDEAEEHIRTRECEQAARWVAQHIASGTPAGEVMVLARKRDRLQRMRDALQALGVASQISEKTQLMEHCEVQDVVALVDTIVSPTNDLALARALKSPLFGVSDDQLVAIAQVAKAQRCTWWQALSKHELLPRYSIELETDSSLKISNSLSASLPEFAKLAANLQSYQTLFATLPSHDALAAVYQHADVLARFMAAAHASQRDAVAANLQALLAAALDVDGGRFLTPYAWVRALKSGSVRAPSATAQAADADGKHSAVQLLTVHGAKGLEAHTVLMLDANAQAEKSRSMDVLIDWPAEQAAPTTFAFLASESAPPVCVKEALEHEQIARAREETNALYVAMTRAQHTLALSAHEVRTPDPTSPWQRFAALGDAVEVDDVQVDDVRADEVEVSEVEVREVEGDPANAASQASRPAHPAAQSKNVASTLPEQHFYIKKMPAGQWNIAGAAINNIVVTIPSATEPAAQTTADSTSSRIGQAMHRLLELYTPGYDLQHAARSVGAQFQLDAAQSAQALQLAQRITQGEAAWVWDEAVVDWQANELELVHAGALLRLDRVVRHQATQTWWVLDYKSSTAPERQQALREQLGRYAEAVRASTPGAVVRAAFITGEGNVVETS